jgi:hypothetical protein
MPVREQWDETPRSKRVGRGHPKTLYRDPWRAEPINRRGEQVQPIADDRKQARARLGQGNGSRMSAEQALPAVSFETTDLVADGSWRDVELSGGEPEASKTGNGFECSKCTQGRESAHWYKDELNSLIAEIFGFDVELVSR